MNETLDFVSLGFVGDIMLSRRIGNAIERGKFDFLKSIENILKGVDILVGNLESPISDSAPIIGTFRAPSKSIEVIRPFKVLNLANNHIFDAGSKGIEDTLRLLNENGIMYVGIGNTISDAYSPAIVETKGHKVAFLGCTTNEIHNYLEKLNCEYFIATIGKSLEDAISDLRNRVDFIVLIVHGGNEFVSYPPPSFKVVLENLVKKGADLIVTHHPHVLGGYQIVRIGENDKLIWYSLGDFIFDGLTKNRKETGILLVNISKGTLKSFSFLPFFIDKDYEIKTLDVKKSGVILGKIERRTKMMGSKYYDKIYGFLFFKEFISYQLKKILTVLVEQGFTNFVRVIVRSLGNLPIFIKKFLEGDWK